MKLLLAAFASLVTVSAECPNALDVLKKGPGFLNKTINDAGVKECARKAMIGGLKKEDFCEDRTCMRAFAIVKEEFGADLDELADCNVMNMEEMVTAGMKKFQNGRKKLCDMSPADLACAASSVSVTSFEVDPAKCTKGPKKFVCKVQASDCVAMDAKCPNEASVEEAKAKIQAFLDACTADVESDACKDGAKQLLARAKAVFSTANENKELRGRQAVCLVNAIQALQEELAEGASEDMFTAVQSFMNDGLKTKADLKAKLPKAAAAAKAAFLGELMKEGGTDEVATALEITPTELEAAQAQEMTVMEAAELKEDGESAAGYAVPSIALAGTSLALAFL